MIYQQGALNTTALVVPDLYVQIVPPGNLVLNGVPTNVIGVVGTASWGAVNAPTIVSSMADYAAAFGAVRNRTFDAGTQVAVATLQGASDFRVVRVTDGTDIAASQTFGGLTILAKYSGSLGNAIQIGMSAGTKANTWRVTVGLPGQVVEVFDNIAGPASGATDFTAFWTGVAAAINSGNSALRGPSAYVVASAPAATPAPLVQTVVLGGGTDGAGVSTTNLIGNPTTHSGMYALSNSDISILVLADATDETQYSTQAAFGEQEGVYVMVQLPAGVWGLDAVTAKHSAGLDDYSCKLLAGDFLYWNDPVNATLRLVSPQGFAAGRLANLSPERSSLNKQIYGIAGSMRTGLAGNGSIATFSYAEMQVLFGAGIDLITNPVPGGNYWGMRLGHNSSSNAAKNGDNYTRLTNYIAKTLDAGVGLYVGEVINVTLFRNITATVNSFMNNLLNQGLLGSKTGALPYNVLCNASNNPDSRTELGYLQCDVNIRYQAINEKFIVNLQGGQTVVITQSNAQ